MPVITRPGEQPERDSVLIQAYQQQDAVIAARFQAIVNELADFANTDMSVPVLGFDAQRYLALKRDARQAMSDLHRSLQRWQQTVS